MNLKELSTKTSSKVSKFYKQASKLSAGARIGSTIGKYLGGALTGGTKLVGGALGAGLKNPATLLATGLGAGIGVAGLNEGAGYLDKSMGGGKIPHFGSSEGNPLWNPKFQGSNLNPKETGWMAPVHALSKPMQTLNYLTGGASEQQGPTRTEDYVNLDGGGTYGGKFNNMQYDPVTGRVSGDINGVDLPAHHRLKELHKRQQEIADHLKSLGFDSAENSRRSRETDSVPRLDISTAY